MRTFIFSCIILGFISGCSETSNEPFVDTNSFDYKYSKSRFQVEGYNSKDSEAAARAIYKFNQAQKNRRGY